MPMYREFWRGALLTGALTLGPIAQAQQPALPRSVDLAVTYTAERAKIVSGNCGCFWLQGGSMDAGVALFHGLGVAANLTGERSSNIAPGVDLSKFAFMAGPRYTLHAHRWNRWLGSKHGTTIFAEGLFGTVHGFDSVFPTSSGIKSSANSFSMQLGGGLDIGLGKGFGLRALELGYVHTSLPNNGSNTQNDLRLAFGVSYHVGKRDARH
jgi:outer membrane immunogenic protein